MSSQFSQAYETMRTTLASRDFSKEKDWQSVITHARKLVTPTGFEASEASVTEDLRTRLRKAHAKGTTEAVSIYAGAGETLSGTGAGALIGPELGKRLGVLKTLRHTYLSKRWGGHKEWVVSIPKSYRDWPTNALQGGLGLVTNLLNDVDENFSAEDKKNIKDASQHAMRWVQRAMIVAASPKKQANLALIARWFADSSSTDAQVDVMASTLNAGLKKLAARIKSGTLIYVDSVSERGTPENVGTEAFFWNEAMNVIYIEQEFFKPGNTLTGMTNWTRILVHEMTHMELRTKDHAYEWQGMAPAVLGSAKTIENADSWAWFCADCAGALTQAQIDNALARR
jgi:hypothetical protein